MTGRRMDSIAIGKIFTFLIVISFAMAYMPQHVEGQPAGGIGVSNDNPTVIDMYIDDHNGLILVHVSLKDLNGWSDIYNVTVAVLDGNGNEISNVTYKQYMEEDLNIPAPHWEENVGDYFDEDNSGNVPVHVEEWVENSIGPIGLNVTFAFTPFSGDIIKINAYDIKGARCGFEGPFSADYEIPPYFADDVMIPIGISFVVAIAGAFLIVYRRASNNKLARLIESGRK